MSIKKARKSHDKQREKTKRHERENPHTNTCNGHNSLPSRETISNKSCHIPKYGKRINEKHATRKKKYPIRSKEKCRLCRTRQAKTPGRLPLPGIKKRENHKSRKKEQYACRYPRLQDIAPTPPASKPDGTVTTDEKNNKMTKEVTDNAAACSDIYRTSNSSNKMEAAAFFLTAALHTTLRLYAAQIT